MGEVALQQVDHGERGPRRHERLALPPHVAAVLDRLHDRRVRRRSADAQLLQPPDQRRLGVARGRLRGVAVGLDLGAGQALALGDGGQDALAVVEVGLGVVRPLDVDPQVPGERDGPTRRRPLGGDRPGAVHADGGGLGQRGALQRGDRHRRLDADRHRVAAGVGHLRGERPLPDELVEPQVGASQLAAELLGGAPALAGGTDGLVGLLGVLDLLAVRPGCVGQEVVAVQLPHLAPGGGDRLLRQRGGVGPHVGDVAPLVEALRGPHDLAGGHRQLPPALLLERGGDERRLGRRAVGLLLDAGDRERGGRGRLDQGAGGRLVEGDGVGALQAAPGVEVLAGGDPGLPDPHEVGGEAGVGRELGLDAPVAGGHERHALALALHHEPHRGALHPPGRQAGGHLAPQHLGDRVAEQAVHDPPGLLGLDEPVVDVPRLLDRLLDRLPGDLVEHHPAHRDPGFEHLGEVPGDGLAFAVLVGGEIEEVGVLEGGSEPLDHVLLARGNDVARLEVVLDVDGEALGVEVTDRADGRLDHEVVTEEAPDGAGLRRGLNDHERGGHRRNS